jgi:hypothetical protein
MFMHRFCAAEFFSLESRGWRGRETLPHNFVHRKCAERASERRTGPQHIPAQTDYRPRAIDPIPTGTNSAAPATKTSRYLNLNRIKYLIQHKQACAHSFPQKVCKDEAARNTRASKSAKRLTMSIRPVPNLTPETLYRLKSIAWPEGEAIAHNFVHKKCGEPRRTMPLHERTIGLPYF